MYWRNAEDSRIHTVLVPSLAEMGRVSVELYRLQPYTSYRIQVSAANADGTGDITDIPSMYTHEDCELMQYITYGIICGNIDASWSYPGLKLDTPKSISLNLYVL